MYNALVLTGIIIVIIEVATIYCGMLYTMKKIQ